MHGRWELSVRHRRRRSLGRLATNFPRKAGREVKPTRRGPPLVISSLFAFSNCNEVAAKRGSGKARTVPQSTTFGLVSLDYPSFGALPRELSKFPRFL